MNGDDGFAAGLTVGGIQRALMPAVCTVCIHDIRNPGVRFPGRGRNEGPSIEFG